MEIKDDALRNWLFVRHQLRNMGFDGDEISCSIGAHYASSKKQIFLVLRTQGKIIQWCTGCTEIPIDKFKEAYDQACTDWNREGQTMMSAFLQSEVYTYRYKIAMALVIAEIHIPKI